MDTTNVITDPAVQEAIKALPPEWQHYVALATSVFVLLTALGRVGMVLYKGGGLVPILKSVLFGSAHAVPGTSVSQEVTLKTADDPPKK